MPGSAGFGDARYDAYLPFDLAPGSMLKVDAAYECAVDDATLRLEKVGASTYTLSSRGFETQDQASAALDELRALLLWYSLQSRAGLRYPSQRGNLTLFDHPQAIPTAPGNGVGHVARARGWDSTDGHYDVNAAVVIPDHKRLLRWASGGVLLSIGIAADSFFNMLRPAIAFRQLRAVTADQKLTLAIEIYAAHRFELGDKARLISLVTSLEALLPEWEVSPPARAALTAAMEIIARYREGFVAGTTDREDLERVHSRLGQLCHEAIGTTLRNYAASVLQRHPSLGDGDQVPRMLRETYDTRSQLLHDGYADPNEVSRGLGFLGDFVPRFLAALFTEVANPNSAGHQG